MRSSRVSRRSGWNSALAFACLSGDDPPEPRRRLAAVGAIALLTAAVAGGQSVFAPSLEAAGPSRARTWTRLDWRSSSSPSPARTTCGGRSTVATSLPARRARARRDASSRGASRRGAPRRGQARRRLPRRVGHACLEFTVDTTPPTIELDGPLKAKPRRALVARGPEEEPACASRCRPRRSSRRRPLRRRVAPPLPRTLLVEAVDAAGNTPAGASQSRSFRAGRPYRCGRCTSRLRLGRRGSAAGRDEADRRAADQRDRDRPEGRVGRVGFDARFRLGGASARSSGSTTSTSRAEDARARDPRHRPARVLPRSGARGGGVEATASGTGSCRRPTAARTRATAASRTSPTRMSGSTTSTSPSRRRGGCRRRLYDYVRRPDGPPQSMRFPAARDA